LIQHLRTPVGCGKPALFFPKFTLDYGLEMTNVLTALGMGLAFRSGADFTGINPAGGLYISLVQHKAHVEVNEVGTVAAAATGTGFVAVCGGGDLQVDHPFLFFIRERFSGTILFMGRVVDPSHS